MPELHIEPGLSIYYQDTNEISSNRVLLLHGLGATCSSWQLQVPSLVDAGYRVVAPDMRGFGSSSYPGGQNNPKSMAGDIERLIEKLSLNRIHVVGISLGGTVALQLATTRPDLIKSLVLTNSFAKLHPNRPSIYIFYLVRLLLVHLFDINTQATFVAERLFPKSGQEDLKNIFREQVRQSNTSSYRSIMRSLAFFDLRKEVQGIRCPTLVVTGENDSVVPTSNQAELTDLIPDSQHVIISDAGHAVSVEKPDVYNQVLIDFISKYD